jgi:precorrin-2 dehydrogenase/sirohydrochlorin ferrochelatase
MRYLGGIVTKGNVKIAISTNGKSPTTAKDCESFLKK